MKVVFWNTKNIEDINIVLSIIEDESPDIFFLAEFKSLMIKDYYKEIDALNMSHLINPGCEKIIILIKKTLKNIELTIQHTDYTGIRLAKSNLNIISVHMPSQINYEFDALKFNIGKFKADFEKHIGETETANILLIGDFNVNPFESPMTHYDGLAATNTNDFNPKKIFRGYSNSLYYNPTWQLYAKSHFPGTYRKPRPSNTSFDVIEHHFLDQVIMSQKLLMSIKSDNIDIIDKTTKYNIFDYAKNKINFSDHLPLKYNFEI